MLIAITGATGFLGRYLVGHLAGSGHRLRCWFRPNSDRSGFDAIKDHIEWLQGSLGDRSAAEALVTGVDAVVHAALQWEGGSFQSSVDEGLEAFMEANLMGSLRLFQAARTAGVPRFVFISSCAVHDVILGDRPLDETHPLWPTSHYGAHKAALEKFVHSLGLGAGWPICAVRPTGIYGTAHPPSASRWYDLIGQVIRGEPITSPKGGKEVHALDVARSYRQGDHWQHQHDCRREPWSEEPDHHDQAARPRHDLRRRSTAANNGAGTCRGPSFMTIDAKWRHGCRTG